MTRRTTATAGVSDHAGWAVVMTVTADGTVIDRRRVEFLGEGIPIFPYHHEAQGRPRATSRARDTAFLDEVREAPGFMRFVPLADPDGRTLMIAQYLRDPIAPA